MILRCEYWCMYALCLWGGCALLSVHVCMCGYGCRVRGFALLCCTRVYGVFVDDVLLCCGELLLVVRVVLFHMLSFSCTCILSLLGLGLAYFFIMVLFCVCKELDTHTLLNVLLLQAW